MGKWRGLQSSSVAALLPGDVAIKAALEREREKEAASSSFALLWLAISVRNIEEGILVLIITRGPSGWWEDFPAAQMQQYHPPSMDLWTALSNYLLAFSCAIELLSSLYIAYEINMCG